MFIQFATFNGTTVDYYATDVTIANTGETHKIAKRRFIILTKAVIEVVRETTLAAFKKYPKQYQRIQGRTDRRICDRAPVIIEKKAPFIRIMNNQVLNGE